MWRQKILNNVEKEIHEIMFITMTPYLYLFLSFKYEFDFQIMWWRNTDIPQFTIMYRTGHGVGYFTILAYREV